MDANFKYLMETFWGMVTGFHHAPCKYFKFLIRKKFWLSNTKPPVLNFALWSIINKGDHVINKFNSS